MIIVKAALLTMGFLLAAAVPAKAASAAPLRSRAAPLDAAAAGRFAGLALACVHQPYPNKISHTLRSDADVASPQQLTPAFYGCYDWHSSVHGHWLLARLLRLYPHSAFAPAARVALERSLTAENLRTETSYLQSEGRASFERPYGLAWLLTLCAELRSWNDPDAQRWARNLAPLEQAAAEHLRQWLPKLRYPIRIGEHNQTVFSFGLIWDWATASHDAAMIELLRGKAAQFYATDVQCPLAYEPSGEDFLSPCLGEADFMRRVLPAVTGEHYEGGHWLGTFAVYLLTRDVT